jgi:hypothetical protein
VPLRLPARNGRTERAPLRRLEQPSFFTGCELAPGLKLGKKNQANYNFSFLLRQTCSESEVGKVYSNTHEGEPAAPFAKSSFPNLNNRRFRFVVAKRQYCRGLHSSGFASLLFTNAKPKFGQ